MTYWLIAGLCFIFATTLFMLFRWGNLPCTGPTPTKSLTFIAILFTSGLDVGLIMFPLTEFGMYANTTENPEYSFANPLAIEFGFWGFLIWTFYFITCFYFCVIEPKVKFFEIPIVKIINNIIIIGTCAFTGYLLLKNLPWYLPALSLNGEISSYYYLIVFAVIVGGVLTSTSIRAIRILSVSTTWFFQALIGLLVYGAVSSGTVDLYTYPQTIALVGEYFTNIHQFAFPMSDYHQFYLFWWLAWCIMIGQFTSRFAGGLRTYQLLLAMLVFAWQKIRRSMGLQSRMLVNTTMLRGKGTIKPMVNNRLTITLAHQEFLGSLSMA